MYIVNIWEKCVLINKHHVDENDEANLQTSLKYLNYETK